MSISVYEFPVDQIKSLNLAQCINTLAHNHCNPLFFNLSQTSLLLDHHCELGSEAKNLISQSNPAPKTLLDKVIPPPSERIELVVFSHITIKVLAELVTFCQLSVSHLNAINHRNHLVSFRFCLTCDDLNSARQLLTEFTAQHQIEAVIIQNAPSLLVPGILVMDMDSTTIEIECIDEIAKLAGVGEQVAAVTELAMQGELDFAQSLHQRVATLSGAPDTILAEVATNIPLMAGLETLITHLKQHQWRIAIASGGFTYFADHLKTLLNLDAVFANELEIIDGKLTGKVLGKVVDAQAKADCLSVLCRDYHIAQQQTVAMGDGANDLIMMNTAHLGVAFHAKPIVKKQAATCINFSGLDCLLHWLA